ncbi:MAG: phosphoribosylglycinamide formyltransferase [Burkholderiales bacterium]|nr:phosphoribosylglycinamide formyltransferase [Burkholderiales bacterium]
MKRIVILISGRGSNMLSILDSDLPVIVAAVISNRADSPGLDIAKARGLPALAIEHRNYAAREDFDSALAEKIDGYSPDFVILAGFMRILGNDFVARYSGRLVNIHPSLLPAFAGTRTHRRALEEGVRIHGCTVHFVTEKLDHGAIIIQAAVPVLENDTEESLSVRVLEQEHKIYPEAIRWLALGRLKLEGHRVLLGNPGMQPDALISPSLDAR